VAIIVGAKATRRTATGRPSWYQPRRASDLPLLLGFAGSFQVPRPVVALESFLRHHDRTLRPCNGSLHQLNRLAAVLNRFLREAYRFHRFVIWSKGHEFLWPTGS
jgi:hypothetical protein